MTKVIVRTEGHYEVHETPFSRAYEWYPACVILECDCGEKLALTGSSTEPACRQCGANHSNVIQDIQEREGRLHHETVLPWHGAWKEPTSRTVPATWCARAVRRR